MNNDFSGKLEAILSNPEMMAQIKNLANSMSKDSSQAPPKEEVKTEEENKFVPKTEQPSGTAPANTAAAEAVPVQAPLLPGVLSMSKINKNISNSRTLLLALKPFLDDKRSGKVDRMLNMMKLSEVAGYLRNFL